MPCKGHGYWLAEQLIIASTLLLIAFPIIISDLQSYPLPLLAALQLFHQSYSANSHCLKPHYADPFALPLNPNNKALGCVDGR